MFEKLSLTFYNKESFGLGKIFDLFECFFVCTDGGFKLSVFSIFELSSNLSNWGLMDFKYSY